MEKEDLDAVKSAQPSFMDGRGLFPNVNATMFSDMGPARFARTAPPVILFGPDDRRQQQEEDPPPPPLPPCFGYGQGDLKLVLSGLTPCPDLSNPPNNYPDPNGTWTLPFLSSAPDGSNCQWFFETTIGGFNVQFDFFIYDDGTCELFLFAYDGSLYFNNATPVPFGPISNDNASCTGSVAGSGGTVTPSF